MMIQEYAAANGLKAVIDRCGVIAGPGQFGKVDQGVFTLWVANHYFGKPLRYTGFGGKGKQVRDLLHPDDLFSLITTQISSPKGLQGGIYNVGGGPAGSTSLLELTRLCQKVTGKTVEIASDPATAAVDIPLYVSDSSQAQKTFGWQPKKSVEDIVKDIHAWIRANEPALKVLFS
jgi:CDP-paratose 2-epimerase